MEAVRQHVAKSRYRSFADRFSGRMHDVSSEELPVDMQPLSPEGSPPPSPSTNLYVKVSHAEGLMAMDSNGKSDPFCIIHVGQKRHKTSTKMKTLEPVWNETFTFRSGDVARANGRISFELFDKDQWTSDDFLGRAELDVYETLKDQNETRTLELKLTAGKWKKLPGFISAKFQEKNLGHVNVALWWGSSNIQSEVVCTKDKTCTIAPVKEEGKEDVIRVKKTDVCPSESHPGSLPSIVHSSRGSVFEEPVVAVLLLEVSQVELNLDPCAPMDGRCVTKCIFKSTSAAAKRHVTRVLGNLVNRRPVTSPKGLGALKRNTTALSDTSTFTDSSLSHTNSFFNQFVFDDVDSDEDETGSNDNDSSDETASNISDLDVKSETQWFYEVKMFDQTRCSESVGYIVNSGLKMDFTEPVFFVVQLPLPNITVTISLCRRCERRRHTYRVPFTVPLFDIMDAEDGVTATSSNGSMVINYTLICLDERPRLLNIQHKLETEDQLRGSIVQQTSLPISDIDEANPEPSDLSNTLAKKLSVGEEVHDMTGSTEVMVGRLDAFVDEIELTQLKSNVHSCYCVMKCEHHWVMTSSQLAERSLSWRWLLKLPVYDPATVISLCVFGVSGRHGQSSRLGKLRIRLSTLQPGRMYESWLPFISDGTEIGRAKCAFRVNYPSEFNLMKGYVKSKYEKEIYAYGLASGTAKSLIRKEHRKLIMQWLDTSEPRIATSVSRHVLDLEKESFSRKRFTMHIRRIQHCFAFMTPISQKIRSLQRWDNPWETGAVCTVVWLVGWNLTSAVVLALLVAFWLVSLQYNVPTSPPSMVDPILMPPAASESDSPKTDRPIEHGNPYLALKSRYDQIQTTLVKVQQVLDSLASFCERIHALVSWRDPVATRLLTMGLLAAAIAVAVLGLKFCLCFAVCWFLRPPSLRTVLPPPPLNFFRRLPSKSDQIL